MEVDCADKCKRNLEVLVRSRYPVVYVVSWEEQRVVDALAKIAARLHKRLFVWSCLSGLVDHGAATGRNGMLEDSPSREPLIALQEAFEFKDPAIFLFRDFGPYLAEKNLSIVRALREIACDFTSSFKTVVLSGTHLQLSPSLEKDVTVVDFPLPTTRELSELVDATAHEVRDNPNLQVELAGDDREELIKAAQGLTLAEAESVFAKALVVHGRLRAEQIPEILLEKRQIIRKSGLLDYCDVDVNIEDVGGLDNLKRWLGKRRLAFTDKAAAFGLPAPRGVLMLGVQGCGKSLCAKAVSTLWKLPLLRLDVGRIFDSFIGGSEENIRKAIAIAEGVAPCILWVDEIDKAFGGIAHSSADAGTSQRVLGTFLTWLAEKRSAVFVVATANSVGGLPPELLRKGRFDEIFFVDLPDRAEREKITAIHLLRRGREPDRFDIARLAAAAEGFSGAEIEEAVVSALFDAFYDDERDLTTQDVLQALKETVPLSRTMEEEISRLRRWCLNRARPATGRKVRPEDTEDGLSDVPCVEGEIL